MRKIFVLAAAGTMFLGAFAGLSSPVMAQTAGDQVLAAVMNGARELKPDLSRHGGDPDGVGSFSGTVSGDQLCFGIAVKGLSAPTAAHLHHAGPTANGSVVIPLVAPATGDPGSSSGCATADPALLADIMAHPHQYYVNVHTVDYPGGAIRGQLYHP